MKLNSPGKRSVKEYLKYSMMIIMLALVWTLGLITSASMVGSQPIVLTSTNMGFGVDLTISDIGLNSTALNISANLTDDFKNLYGEVELSIQTGYDQENLIVCSEYCEVSYVGAEGLHTLIAKEVGGNQIFATITFENVNLSIINTTEVNETSIDETVNEEIDSNSIEILDVEINEAPTEFRVELLANNSFPGLISVIVSDYVNVVPNVFGDSLEFSIPYSLELDGETSISIWSGFNKVSEIVIDLPEINLEQFIEEDVIIELINETYDNETLDVGQFELVENESTDANNESPTNITSLNTRLIQGRAETNTPLVWTVLTFDNSIILPVDAYNIRVMDDVSEIDMKNIYFVESNSLEKATERSLETGIPSLSGNVINDGIANVVLTLRDLIGLGMKSKGLYINKSIDKEIFIEYYTQGPKATETIINPYKKKIELDSKINLVNVSARTSIANYPKDSITLWNVVNNTRTEFEIRAYLDTDGDGLIDEIEWNVPSLDNAEFEVSIAVLNVQSYPVIGGMWNVRFDTLGSADLRISAINSTSWSDENEFEDLQFIKVMCGLVEQNYTWVNNTVLIENYSCSETSIETSKVITLGKHHLMFEFGNEVAFANNQAGGALVQHETVTSAGSTIGLSISSVNTSKAFSLFSARQSSATPDDSQFTSDISLSTTVTYDRYTAGPDVTLSSQVVTSQDIVVQRGSQALSSGTASHTATINAVDLTKTFVLVEGRCADATSGDTPAGIFRGELLNETTLYLERGNAGYCAATVSWQVIEWDGAKVQSGTDIVLDNTDSVTVNLDTAVNLSEAFIVFGSANAGSDQGMDSNLLQASFNNASQIFITQKTGATYASSIKTVTWYVVELNQSKVQSGNLALSGVGVTPVSINKVNTSRSFILSSGWNTGGGQTYSNSLYNVNFSNSSLLSFDKETNSQTQDIIWFVVELPDVFPDLDYPIFSSESVTPLNDTSYNPNTNHYFNVSVAETNGTVYLNFNGDDYSATLSGDHYYVMLSNLTAGTYHYYWYSYGSGYNNNYNSTTTRTYVINKNVTTMYTRIDGLRSDKTLERLNSIFIEGELVGETFDISIYSNGSLLNSGASKINVTQPYEIIGLYNITTLYSGNENYTSAYETWWLTVEDTVPPALNDIENSSISDTNAVISWNTPEVTNASVKYGTTLAMINRSENSDFVLLHGIVLTYLDPNTLYYFNLSSCDPYNNCNSSGPYNFTTLAEPDILSPIITNITNISITETTVNITWITDENANSTVLFGLTPLLGNNTVDTRYLTKHNVLLSGLDPVTTYYYNVSSCDPSGNCNISTQNTFATVDLTAPFWSANRTYPQSEVVWSLGNSYQFNTTWIDTITSVANVVVEHNFSGSLQNYSPTGSLGNEYYYDYSNLHAGIYSWRMIANDTYNNTNSTDYFTYEVSKASSSINLTLNGSEENMTFMAGTAINVTATLITPASGYIEILNNGNVISSGQSPLTTEIEFTYPGTYVVTAKYVSTQNYSESTNNHTVRAKIKSVPTSVYAENAIVTLGTTETLRDIDLGRNYNMSKTFIKVNHASGFTNNAEPDESTPTVRFINSSTIRVERYATQSHTAYASYSILEASNIYVWNWSHSFSLGSETGTVNLSPSLVPDYDNKCFVESHRNIMVNSATISDFAHQEVRTTISSRNTIELQRDTEGTDVAAPAIQYGYVVCMLDNATVQTGTFNIAGDLDSESTAFINPVEMSNSFAEINYYQADDGVGQNSLIANISSPTTLVIHRDEAGGGETAIGTYYVVSFENNTGATVQNVNYAPPSSGTLLEYYTGTFNTVQRNRTLISCESTMTAGGGTAHTRGQFAYELNATDNSIYMIEARDRRTGQDSDVLCYVVEWPSETTYVPSDLNISYNTFDGMTTDFRNHPSPDSVCNAVIEVTQYGMITWNSCINTLEQNLSKNIVISGNSISVNSSDLDSSINSSAIITFYNITNIYDPVIKVDNSVCTDCSLVSITGTNYTYAVNHFSSYTVANGTNMTVWDVTDPEEGSQTILMYENMAFYTNYTNSTGASLNGAGIYCEFEENSSGVWSSPVNMTYNVTSELYEYNRTFTHYGNFTFNVSCFNNVASGANMTLSDNFTITKPSWSIYYGKVLSDLVMGSNSGHTIFNFTISELRGNLYFTDSDSEITWSKVYEVGRNTAGAVSTNDFADLDTVFGINLTREKVENTFGLSASLPRETIGLNVFNRTLSNVPVSNLTGSGIFKTGILWESKSEILPDEFDLTDDETILFVAPINESKVGKYGTYDYEIKVPYTLGAQEGINNQVAIYIELK